MKNIYVIILLVFSILFSYYLISNFLVESKSKYLISNNFLNKFKKIKFILNKNDILLKKIGNPYNLNSYKYLFIKYILSTIIFLIILFRSNNLVISIIYFIIFFYLPNFLVYIFKKNESIKIIKDITNIVRILKLSTLSKIPLNTSLKISIDSIDNKRFKLEFSKFVNDYIMLNYNIDKASEKLKEKFDTYEFNMFISIISEGEKEGKMYNSLNVFSNTLELSYFKYLKYKQSKRMMFVVFSTVISLINIIAITVYPMIYQISDNMQNIFK